MKKLKTNIHTHLRGKTIEVYTEKEYRNLSRNKFLKVYICIYIMTIATVLIYKYI